MEEWKATKRAGHYDAQIADTPPPRAPIRPHHLDAYDALCALCAYHMHTQGYDQAATVTLVCIGQTNICMLNNKEYNNVQNCAVFLFEKLMLRSNRGKRDWEKLGREKASKIRTCNLVPGSTGCTDKSQEL